MLRYPCLVLDHDDTTVDSTSTVNYPQFLQALSHFRPGFSMSLDEYTMHCFDPGFYVMCERTLHYSPQEMEQHLQMWKNYHKSHHPAFFPGIPELIARQKAAGGYVCVVSHSSDDVIRAAYAHSGVLQPDLIFGAELPPEKRKPSPWPLEEIMQRLSLTPKDLLMVDDMPHGAVMAKAVGVDFAGAGWYGMLPEIETKMRDCSDFFFTDVFEFTDFLFHEKETCQE